MLQSENFGEINWRGEQVHARPGEWIVRFDGISGPADTQVKQLNDLLADIRPDLSVHSVLGRDGLVMVRGPATETCEGVVPALSQLPGYRYVEPNQVVWVTAIPNDPQFANGNLWGLHNTGQQYGTADADIDAPEAWDISTGSRSVVVGVVDSGIKYDHPDLAANIWTNPGEVAGNGLDDDGNGYIDDVHGYDFVNNDGDPMDDNGHGTHVAGTIGAVGNNAAGVVGVNWSTSLMALKFLNVGGVGSTANAIRAISYATVMREQYGVNVRLINSSWDGTTYSQALYDAIAASGQADILLVASAGNRRLNNDTSSSRSYPASYDLSNIVAVAATDRNDRLADFSSYGLISVDVGAPGVHVLSTWKDGQYRTISGTSMAAPHVAGALALLAASEPELYGNNLRNRLLGSTDFVPDLFGKSVTAGRVNARNLLNPTYVPPAHAIYLTSLNLADPAPGGNNDGYANPGELITVRPSIVNAGTTAATGATLEIAVSHPGVTLIGPTTLHLGSIDPNQLVQPAGLFQVRLDSSMGDLERVQFSFTVRHDVGQQMVTGGFYTVKLQPRVQMEVGFEVGEMVADPTRNRVYVVDRSNQRIVAIDTDLGQKVAQASFDGRNGLGRLTVSGDGTKLFVAVAWDQKIKVFALPDLTPLATFEVPFAPIGLAYGANDRLYVSIRSLWTYQSYFAIQQLDASTGEVLGSFGGAYQGALLRTNSAGTRLFITETDIVIDGGGAAQELDIASGGTPVVIREHPYDLRGTTDIVFDDQYNRLYIQSSSLGGLQVAETGSFHEAGIVWRYPSAALSGSNVVAMTGVPLVYSAADWQGSTIYRFLRSDGTAVGQYPSTLPLLYRRMAMTPNGKILYGLQTSSGDLTRYELGLIGGTSLTVDPTPLTPSASIFRDSFNPYNFNPQFTVTFDKLVTGVDLTDFTLTTTGISGASITRVTQIAGGAYQVFVDSGTGNGTVRLNLIDNDTIRDLSGNPLGGPGTGALVTGPVITIDRTAPVVLSITRAGPNPSDAARVPFVVTFSEDVHSVDVGDFALTTTGVTGAAVASVTALSPSVYSVLVNTGVGNGTIRLNLIRDGSIRDRAGNTMSLGADFTTGEVYTMVDSGAAALRVISFTPTATGFSAQFNLALGISDLNLYDTQTGGLGPADVTLVGATTGPVRGSLVVNAAGNGFTFVRTGGVLMPDTYTARLRSAANGFHSLGGGLLDGNGDGRTGDDRVATFTVSTPTGVVVSVPDIARGPGQTLAVPLRLSNGSGIRTVELTLSFDPMRLSVSSAAPGIGVPSDATVTLTPLAAGRVRVLFNSPTTPLGTGPIDFVRLTAQVPAPAAYGSNHLLDLADLSINAGALAAADDDGLHVVAYLGDATGNAAYSVADATRVLRVAIGLDSGFPAQRLADPIVLADINGDSRISAIDATRILQEAIGIDRPEIPPLP